MRLGGSTPQTAKADPAASSRSQETASQVFKGKKIPKRSVAFQIQMDAKALANRIAKQHKRPVCSEITMKFIQGSLWSGGFLGKGDTLNKTKGKK